jgi:alpha-D-xyloside xylohydrolase
LKIPAGAIWLDRPFGSGELGWGGMDFDSSFPDPPKMIRELNDRGMKLLLWSANRCSGKMFQEGSDKHYLFPAKWPAADISRPEVYDWWKEKLNEYVRLGVRGYKIDRGEENEMPDAVQNQFAVLFPKLSAEGLSAAYGNDYFIFTRNVNDLSRKFTAVWNGDSWPTFGGLQTSIKNGLRAGLINFPMWGSDTGGYFAPSHNTKELLARWLEFSSFSPMMEVILGPKRTVWYDYDDELIRIAQTFTRIHHDLIPYTRSYMYESTRTGMPIMRALVLAYPDDDRFSDLWDEYLYGADILVAPVATAAAKDRKVYLPAGRWIDYNDKRTVHDGRSTITATAALDQLPLFVREGAIIPRGDIVKLNNNWDSNWKPVLRIEIFPAWDKESEFRYFTGNATRIIKATPKDGGLAITLDDLGVNGSVEVYCRKVTEVRRNHSILRAGEYHYDAEHQKLSIPFQGAASLEINGAEGLF